MKTNYKVFLSSTHKVLTDEREVLTKSLLEINCIPIGTELKNCSSDSEISEFRNKLIEDSDIMIIFLGDWNGEEINHEEIINI